MHTFKGKWITDSEFSSLEPRNVFHRHIDKVDIPCDEHITVSYDTCLWGSVSGRC